MSGLNSLIVAMSILDILALTLLLGSAPRARIGRGYIIVMSTIICLTVSGCVHSPRLARPEQCSPLPQEMVCPSRNYTFTPDPADPFGLDANGFVCFRPEEIEPYLERCGD